MKEFSVKNKMTEAEMNENSIVALWKGKKPAFIPIFIVQGGNGAEDIG